jgi:hypothetical protein
MRSSIPFLLPYFQHQLRAYLPTNLGINSVCSMFYFAAVCNLRTFPAALTRHPPAPSIRIDV